MGLDTKLMRLIPEKLRKEIAQDARMKRCIYANKDCSNEFGNKPGRVEWEHCFTYANKQINERWAIIGVCWYHHRGPGLDKAYNKFVALSRMTDTEFDKASRKYPSLDFTQMHSYLRNKYKGVDN